MFRQLSFLLLLVFRISAIKMDSTLLQLHVLFRHGDRTPDAVSMYPKDPNINDTWYPDGLGALTKVGRMQEYKVGVALREAYNDFLGPIYTPYVMDAWSTDYNRTKMSMQLALAGLWPPAPSQVWNADLPWQPVPYNYVAMANDPLMKFPLTFCPKYKTEYDNIVKRDEFQGWLLDNENIIKYINYHTGLQVKTLSDLFKLYWGLYAEDKTGRILPEWTKKVYPGFLAKAQLLFQESQVFTDILKKYSGGRLVKKIIDDAKDKINGTLKPKDRKLFIYAGHEFNIVYLLAALNVYKEHIPPYASYIVVELHKIDGVHGFKILYQDYQQERPKILTIPGCESFCPLDKFVELTANIIPTDEAC